MNCAQAELLLCDYVDGTLDAARQSALTRHLGDCSACAALARDVQGAVAFIERTAVVEPPGELVTRILFEIPARRPAERRGFGRLLRHWLEPVLQPRFAMGMAMTVLSFAMLARFAGIQPRQVRPDDLRPAKIWETVDDRVHRGWDRVVKYYNSLRFVYEIQARLREWTEQDQEERKAESGAPAAAPVPKQPAGIQEREPGR